jgi:hypothetical protein
MTIASDQCFGARGHAIISSTISVAAMAPPRNLLDVPPLNVMTLPPPLLSGPARTDNVIGNVVPGTNS